MGQSTIRLQSNSSLLKEGICIGVDNVYAAKRASGWYMDLYYNTPGTTSGQVYSLRLSFNLTQPSDSADQIMNAIMRAQQAPGSIVDVTINGSADGGKLYVINSITPSSKTPI